MTFIQRLLIIIIVGLFNGSMANYVPSNYSTIFFIYCIISGGAVGIYLNKEN